MGNVTINSDLEAMQERADRLAKQKSYLQLIIGMMQKLGKESGLKNTIESLLETIIVNMGGTNATLHFFIGDEIYKSDIQHGKIKIENIIDEYVKKVIETHEFIEIEHEFSDTLLQTPEFTKAFTWVIPLLVGNDLTGVITSVH